MAETFSKQPYESFTITADFSANLSPAITDPQTAEEVIISQVLEVTDKNGLDSAAIVVDGTTLQNDSAGKVSVLVLAGEEVLSPYKISFRIITSAPYSHKWELDVFMNIGEGSIW